MKILICGVGAIGSNLVNLLVPDFKGDHEIHILDMDSVEERNVTPGTQCYTPDQVGMSKVEALQYNMYKWHRRDIIAINGKLTDGRDPLRPHDFRTTNLAGYSLIIDCFDNHESRKLIHEDIQSNRIFRTEPTQAIHLGFSDQFTFAVEWEPNYTVPSDIVSGLDICEMAGAASFVKLVSSLGSLVIQEYLKTGKQREFTGNRFALTELK